MMITSTSSVHVGSTTSHPDSYSNSWFVQADLSLSYQVTLEKSIFSERSDLLKNLCQSSKIDSKSRALLFLDSAVHAFYFNKIERYFSHHGVGLVCVLLEAGEENKSLESLQKVLDAIVHFDPMRRQEPIFVVGGGVVTDIVGFAASIYKRGIPFVRIPTTLMGMIDAAIGIKTAVNFSGKNRIGTYYPASHSFIDPSFLKTLPNSHIANGMAEIIKMGVVCSKDLFEKCEVHGKLVFKTHEDPKILAIMSISIESMLKELASNLYEHCLKRAVDFGHTWSPEIEMSDKPLLHGYAVSVDMVFSSCLAKILNLINLADFERIYELLKNMGLPIFHSKMVDINFLKNAIRKAKLHRDGKLNLPVPSGIGEVVFLEDISNGTLEAARKLFESIGESHKCLV